MRRLDIVDSLISNFNSHGIKYCHFKSNEHLDAALLGDTDLDILFHRSHIGKTENSLFESGFIRMRAVGIRKYRGIEDYIGIDEQTGKIVHVHAHYLLVGGESGVKPYHIKLEDHILRNAKHHSESCCVFTSKPEDEMLLLFVRAALKLKTRHHLMSYIRDAEYTGDDKREFVWLLERISYESFEKFLPECMNTESNLKIFKDIFKKGLTHRRIKALFDGNKELFAQWRYIDPIRTLVLRLNHFYVKVNRKFKLGNKKPIFRTFEKKGLIIAILGADGAGKSTQNKLIPKELQKKIDVLYMYMGAGDGKSSWHRYPLKLVAEIRRKINKKAVRKDQGRDHLVSLSQYGLLTRTYKVLWALSLAFERKQKLERIEKWKSKGGVVVCDRYPQSAIFGFNDGPLLFEYLSSSNSFMRGMSEWELLIYKKANTMAPDLVIKLWTEVSELKRRRPAMIKALIQRKQDAILSLDFPPKAHVVRIHSSGGAQVTFSKIMAEVHKVFIRNFDATTQGR